MNWLAPFSSKVRRDPRMRPYFDRWNWDLDHLYDSASFNPYIDATGAPEGDLKPKNRTGLQDITHAYKNIAVEWDRLKEKDRAGNA